MSDNISVLTCYDYSFAKALDGLLDYLLVGDSVDMVVYGRKSTVEVEFKKIYYHTQAVAKGLTKGGKTKLIADMPKKSLVNKKTLFKLVLILLKLKTMNCFFSLLTINKLPLLFSPLVFIFLMIGSSISKNFTLLSAMISEE